MLPLRSRLRPLPRTIPPFANETLRSYLYRVEKANHLTSGDLRFLLTGHATRQRPIPVEPFAEVIGIPGSHLLHSLPELRIQPRRGGCGLNALFIETTLACLRCLASKGLAQEKAVTVWAREDHFICMKHRRWTGHRNRNVEGQADLTEHPDILRAQVRHRRLIRRHGHAAVAEAFNRASRIMHCEDAKQVFTWFDNSRAFERRMKKFFNDAGTDRLPAAYLEAAHYPDIVTFATWLISPYWRTVLTEAPLSERLLFFEWLHRLGLIRTGIPAAEATMLHWLESLTMTGRPPVPFWLLSELKYWPPGRTEWLRDYLRLEDEPTPDEWIKIAKTVIERAFDLRQLK